MSFLSYIMPKLAWIIPLCLLVFFGYVFYKGKETDARDAYIKERGVKVDAQIMEVVYDKLQRVNNYFVAVVTIRYQFNGKDIISKRGLAFLVTDQEKIVQGKTIKVKINPDAPERFYFEGYRNY